MDIDRLDPHAHTTDSKALSSLKNFRIGLSAVAENMKGDLIFTKEASYLSRN